MIHTGMAQRIREAAKRLGTFGVRELADEVGLPDGQAGVQTYREVRKVRNALRDFRRRGEIIHVARGVWRYCGRDHEGRGKGVREKVYRAMYNKRTFSARDLVLLTDADESYIRVLVRKLVAAGVIRRTGGRPINGTRRKEAVFALVDPDQFYLKYVKG